jgi:hypothetical protein
MSDLLIIGDSHAAYLGHALSRSNCNFLEIFSGGVSAYNLNYEKYDIPDIFGIPVVVSFGEIDIRNKSVKYNNAKEVAERLVKKTKERFPNNRVLFIQPNPQPIDLKDFIDPNLDPRYSLEDRLVQQKAFYEALNDSNIEIVPTSTILGLEMLNRSDTIDGLHLIRSHTDKIVKYIHKSIGWQYADISCCSSDCWCTLWPRPEDMTNCDHKFVPVLYGCPPEIYAPEVRAGTALAGGNRMPNSPDYRCKKCGAGKQNDL